jgi:hypothetical protein
MGSHFTKERLQYGLYGLYPKYRVYVEPITAFLGMVGHGLVVSTLQHDRGTLSNKREFHVFKVDVMGMLEMKNVYKI